MLSRVADSIYWLNRYVERAENVARFIDVNLNLMLDCPSGLSEQWKPLVLTTGDLPLFEERYGQATTPTLYFRASGLLAKMLAPSEKSSLEKCGSK